LTDRLQLFSKHSPATARLAVLAPPVPSEQAVIPEIARSKADVVPLSIEAVDDRSMRECGDLRERRRPWPVDLHCSWRGISALSACCAGRREDEGSFASSLCHVQVGGVYFRVSVSALRPRFAGHLVSEIRLPIDGEFGEL
jgi:hypothetical protein